MSTKFISGIVRKSLIAAAMVSALVVIPYMAAPKAFYQPLIALNRNLAGLSEHTVKVDRHEIHYLSGGSGETIVLLHGIYAEKDHWVDFARHLTPNFHVIALDMPGFGESSRLENEPYDYPSQVRRLSLFMDAIGVSRAHIAGSSMGGAIAALFALNHPDRVLSLAFIGAPHGIRSPKTTEIAKRIAAGEIPLIARTPEEFKACWESYLKKGLSSLVQSIWRQKKQPYGMLTPT